MRIFKNRGDIYFSKVNKQKSTEQKILIIALVAVVCFTVVFTVFLAISNDFSAKKFFAPDETVTSLSMDESQYQQELPKVSGKTNMINFVTKEENLLFVVLIQFDMDNVSYKVACLKSETVVDGVSLYDTYKKSGSENVKTAVETLLTTEFDYYVQIESDDLADFFDDLGKVTYPIADDIRYKGDSYGLNYSVNIKAGEQKLNGTQAVNLLRYYVENDITTSANTLVLNCLQQQINAENYENGQKLFSQFISVTSTNITVRDFSSAGDEFTVLTNEITGVGAYSADFQYNSNAVEGEELQKLKGYFVK